MLLGLHPLELGQKLNLSDHSPPGVACGIEHPPPQVVPSHGVASLGKLLDFPWFEQVEVRLQSKYLGLAGINAFRRRPDASGTRGEPSDSPARA
jgi:hypothetical protein